MIAIDASALVKFLLKEEGWRKVEDALKEGALSVDLILKEVSNAILKRFRRKEMVREEVDAVLRALEILAGRALKIEEEKEYIRGAIKLALESGVTVYDAIYIVFSKAKNIALMTADKRQTNVALREGVNVVLVE